MIEAVGWIGACLLALCAVPQAYKCCVDGHADGLSWGFLGMWLGGELFTLAYVAVVTPNLILFLNYFVNIVCLAVIIAVKVVPFIIYRPREKRKPPVLRVVK